MKFKRKLPDVEELQQIYALTDDRIKEKKEFIASLQSILSGAKNRKLLLIGPCSADREDAVLEYAYRLAGIADRVKGKLCIVPRIYTSKPRTKGAGYKGMLHNPDASAVEEDLLEGIAATRKMHLRVIKETGFFPADEMLYPEEIYYIYDLLSYMAVGARSVEDQGHRMTASDNVIPVGMKNPMGGSKIALVNSVIAAQTPHRMIYRGWEVETEGNPFAHCILRGFTNKTGKNYSNYHYEDLRELHDICLSNNVLMPGVIIDCNHANSNKEYDEQPRIVKEVLNSCKANRTIHKFVKGFMVESYLVDGCQKLGNGIYGKSITDPCLGWEKTERLILEMAEYL